VLRVNKVILVKKEILVQMANRDPLVLQVKEVYRGNRETLALGDNKVLKVLMVNRVPLVLRGLKANKGFKDNRVSLVLRGNRVNKV
jgi:hypothetical protein